MSSGVEGKRELMEHNIKLCHSSIDPGKLDIQCLINAIKLPTEGSEESKE